MFQELENLLSYASAESWACLITPSSDQMLIHGLGNIMLQGFMEYEKRKPQLGTIKFENICQNHIEQLRMLISNNACCRIVLGMDNKDAIQSLKYPDCDNFMKKKIQFRCCHS